MKKFIITEEEKSKILKMYLGEQDVASNQNVTQQDKQDSNKEQYVYTGHQIGSDEYGNKIVTANFYIYYIRKNNECNVTKVYLSVGDNNYYQKISDIPKDFITNLTPKSKTNCTSLYTLYKETYDKLTKEGTVKDNGGILNNFLSEIKSLSPMYNKCTTDERYLKKTFPGALKDFEIYFNVYNQVDTFTGQKAKCVKPKSLYLTYNGKQSSPIDLRSVKDDVTGLTSDVKKAIKELSNYNVNDEQIKSFIYDSFNKICGEAQI